MNTPTLTGQRLNTENPPQFNTPTQLLQIKHLKIIQKPTLIYITGTVETPPLHTA
jgi:hypothetical protein